jgi:hypothetical protein
VCPRGRLEGTNRLDAGPRDAPNDRPPPPSSPRAWSRTRDIPNHQASIKAALAGKLPLQQHSHTVARDNRVRAIDSRILAAVRRDTEPQTKARWDRS